jgi:hypothetical protein
MSGAASTTTGSITIQDTSHAQSQCRRNGPIAAGGRLAMPAAMNEARQAGLNHGKNEVAMPTWNTGHCRSSYFLAPE